MCHMWYGKKRKKAHFPSNCFAKPSLQCWSEIIETNAKNGVVFDATSNEQPIKMTNPVGFKTSLLYL